MSVLYRAAGSLPERSFLRGYHQGEVGTKKYMTHKRKMTVYLLASRKCSFKQIVCIYFEIDEATALG